MIAERGAWIDKATSAALLHLTAFALLSASEQTTENLQGDPAEEASIQGLAFDIRHKQAIERLAFTDVVAAKRLKTPKSRGGQRRKPVLGGITAAAPKKYKGSGTSKSCKGPLCRRCR